MSVMSGCLSCLDLMTLPLVDLRTAAAWLVSTDLPARRVRTGCPRGCWGATREARAPPRPLAPGGQRPTVAEAP